MRRLGWGLVIPLCIAGATAVGCGGQEAELCALADECENGNDADIAACENDLGTVADVASLYGCDAEWDELMACAVEHNDCDDGDFEIDDRCEGEAEDYEDCVD